MKLCLACFCFHFAARACCAAEVPIAQDVLIQLEPDATPEYHEVELLQTAIHLDAAVPALQHQAKSQVDPPLPTPPKKLQADLAIASHGGQGMEGKAGSFPDVAMVESCIKEVSEHLHPTYDLDDLDVGDGTRFDMRYGFTPQMESYIALANDSSVKTICEAGFYTGESSALWLCTNPYATLYSFDIQFPPDSLRAIKSKFGERFVHTEGDSMQTLTEFATQAQPPSCDLMIMDGGHFGPVPRSDLKNYGMIASKSADRKHTLIVDEVFAEDPRITDESMIETVTQTMLDAWHHGMFDEAHSACFSYQPFSDVVYQLTTAGMRAMNSTYPLGGWCELTLAK